MFTYKNKGVIFLLGLSLLSLSLSAMEKMQPKKMMMKEKKPRAQASAVAHRLAVRYNFDEPVIEEALLMIEDGRDKVMEMCERFEKEEMRKIHVLFCEHYDPSKKQPKLSTLKKKLSEKGLNDTACVDKVDKGVAKIKSSPVYKQLTSDQKQDVYYTVANAQRCKYGRRVK